MSPQIVTETLFALAVRPAGEQTVWIPNEVHLITTSRGAEHARLNLLSGEPGWFRQLRQDYGLPDIGFGPESFHVIADQQGQALSDIRSPLDNEAAADQIAALVRRFTQDDNTELHVSLAGGRKTMGYYLGYALSLYGRPQDRLSHVLVSEPFESHPGFYYPTPYERVIHTLTPEPVAMDCAKASVQLAEIPFVRLRDGLPKRLLTGQTSFTAMVDEANKAQHRPLVEVLLQTRTLRVSGVDVPVGSAEFALYSWLANRAKNDDGEVDWQDAKVVEAEYLSHVNAVFGLASSESQRTEDALRAPLRQNDGQTLANYFQVQMSRVNKTLREELGDVLAKRCAIERVGPRGKSRYRLPPDMDLRVSVTI
jgi:CRISPR-associated protein (TIGR02584 family)